MSTEIKPIKCPQCGSEKHDDLGDKRFRCRSCGTEFFLDDDDITIHINHHFDAPRSTSFDSLRPDVLKKVALIVGIPLVVLFLIIVMPIFESRHIPKVANKTAIEVDDNILFNTIILCKNKATCFYIVNRSYNEGYDEEERDAKEGIYYGFKDCETGKVLVEHQLATRKDANKREIFSSPSSSMLQLSSPNRYLITFDNQWLYEVNTDKLLLNDLTLTLIQEKKALTTGIARISPLNYNEGKGFLIVNNLSEKYYYFPQSNRLYTEEAFTYAQRLNENELEGKKEKQVLFMLEHKENEGGQVGNGNLRLWRVPITYFPGDPNEFYDFWVFDGFYKSRPGNRIHNPQPIGNWFIGFNAIIMYYNSHFLLLKYNPIMGENANVVFQLRDNLGGIIWTKAIPHCQVSAYAVYDGKALWLSQYNWEKDSDAESRFVRLDIYEGTVTMREGLRTNYTLTDAEE